MKKSFVMSLFISFILANPHYTKIMIYGYPHNQRKNEGVILSRRGDAKGKGGCECTHGRAGSGFLKLEIS